ncbi:MAG: putative membrane protein YqgA involved in biofilm formation [Alpinimonas sp.]
MIGLGTVLNIATILIGATLGVLIGNRLPERTTRVVTDALGLITIVLGGLNVMALADRDFVAAVGSGLTLLIVLGALLIGGIAGSLLNIEQRLESFGGWLQRRFSSRSNVTGGSAGNSAANSEGNSAGKERFITGFVDASLVFCIGPLAILGALSDGTGNGIEQLALKSTLDGFAALAFAAALGWGVAASALPVGLWQGLLTLLAFWLGSVMSAAVIAAITATGGVLLLGVGLRLLKIRQIAVGDLLPALIVAPLLTLLVIACRPLF